MPFAQFVQIQRKSLEVIPFQKLTLKNEIYLSSLLLVLLIFLLLLFKVYFFLSFIYLFIYLQLFQLSAQTCPPLLGFLLSVGQIHQSY